MVTLSSNDGEIAGELRQMSDKVPVYDGEDIVAHVKYNSNLDYWDGRNYTCGSTGRHLGITVLKDGRFVLIHGTQWQGERSHAEIVPAEEALRAIIRTDSTELLESPRFKALQELYNEKFSNQELEEDEEPASPAES